MDNLTRIYEEVTTQYLEQYELLENLRAYRERCTTLTELAGLTPVIEYGTRRLNQLAAMSVAIDSVRLLKVDEELYRKIVNQLTYNHAPENVKRLDELF